jgi:hypothetical protein
LIVLTLHHSLFLLSTPTFHRVVPLLQTCSTYEFVYDHVYFWLHVYLLDLSSTYRENMQPLSFWICLTSLTMMFSSFIHLPLNDKIPSFFMAEYYLAIKYSTWNF